MKLKTKEKALLKMIYKSREPVSYFGQKVYKGKEIIECFLPYMFENLWEEGLVEEYKSHHYRPTAKGELYILATATNKTICQTLPQEFITISSSFMAG